MTFEDMVESLAIGIVGSLIAASIWEAMRSQSGWTPSPTASPSPVAKARPDRPIDARANNRRRVTEFAANVFFYAFTFYLIYVVAFFPIIIKAWRFGEPILLANAREIGTWLPHVLVTSDVVQSSLVALCFAIYAPALVVMGLLANMVRPLVNCFVIITPSIWRRTQVAIVVVLAAMLAIASIWLYYSLTLTEAAMALFFVVVVTGALVGGRR